MSPISSEVSPLDIYPLQDRQQTSSHRRSHAHPKNAHTENNKK
ncbi:hypothetical protein DENIT_80396 [Pseudomonas veronii]|nr:hypothetical protein DENIT_80396 [Pseudomonas veronii]